MSNQILNVISTENGPEDWTENIIIGNKIESGKQNTSEDKIGNRIRRK